LGSKWSTKGPLSGGLGGMNVPPPWGGDIGGRIREFIFKKPPIRSTRLPESELLKAKGLA